MGYNHAMSNADSRIPSPAAPPPIAHRVGVIGDGAMGTLCALILAGGGHGVRLWGRSSQRIRELEQQRENHRYLPGVPLPDTIELTDSDNSIAQDADFLICAVPAQYIRPVLQRLKPHIPQHIAMLSIAKGIENHTLLRPTQIILDVLPGRSVAALSGPCIAAEAARQLPATLVAASADDALMERIQQLMTTRYLRIYRNADLTGVELAGAMKNVIAIAAGVLDGMKMGVNAKAALLTRGLVEITRLGTAMGAQADTFSGLAGLGDLVTTGFSMEGRNRSFGQRVGQGATPQAAMAETAGVVEGVATTLSVLELARRYGVEMPISEMLYAVLFHAKPPQQGIAELMSRQPKAEQNPA